jgi:hypothetical protein
MVIEAEQPPRNFEAHCMSARLEKEAVKKWNINSSS